MKKNLLLAGAFLTFGFASNAQWVTENTGFAASARGINSIYIANANTAWAVAFDGSGTSSPAALVEYTKTSNGGATWTADSIKGAPAGDGLASICALNKDTAWASVFGDQTSLVGGVYRTNDGGATWTQQTTAAYTVSSFPDWVYFFDKNNGISFGDPNPNWEIYTTSNGGTTWTAVPAANLPTVPGGEWGNANGYAVAGGSIYATTNMGEVIKSSDMGMHWTSSTVLVSGMGINNISFKDANNGLAVLPFSGGDSLYKTTDGAVTWTRVAKTGRFLNSGLAYTTLNGGSYVCTGAATGMYGTSYSLDNGTTWMMEDTTNQHLAVAFMGSTGWTGGFNTSSTVGGIYKWTGTMFAVNELHATESGISVYPNPNNGVFQITLNNFSGKQTQVAVYDLLGNVVFQSADNAAGSQFVKQVDLSSYATGMYIVRVTDGTKVYTAKVTRQ